MVAVEISARTVALVAPGPQHYALAWNCISQWISIKVILPLSYHCCRGCSHKGPHMNSLKWMINFLDELQLDRMITIYLLSTRPPDIDAWTWSQTICRKAKICLWLASCWSPPGTAHAAQAVPAPRVGGDHVAALARVHGVALGPGHVATRGPRHQQQHAWVPGHVTFF